MCTVGCCVSLATKALGCWWGGVVHLVLLPSIASQPHHHLKASPRCHQLMISRTQGAPRLYV